MPSFVLPALPAATRLEVLQVDAAPIVRHSACGQQSLGFQAFDQPGKLTFVATEVGDQITERRPGISGEETKEFALQVRQLMQTITHSAILLRAKEVHDRVDRFENSLGRSRGLFVDIINRFLSHSRYCQQKLENENPIFGVPRGFS